MQGKPLLEKLTVGIVETRTNKLEEIGIEIDLSTSEGSVSFVMNSEQSINLIASVAQSLEEMTTRIKKDVLNSQQLSS